jgi:soluble cytochrome b562
MKTRRRSISDIFYGPEPILTAESTSIELGTSYNWFNYFHDNDDAKQFVVDYLTKNKVGRAQIKVIETIDSNKLRAIGWNCRLLTTGTLPEAIKTDTLDKLSNLINDARKQIKPKKREAPVISVQEHIQNRVEELIGALEAQVDIFIREGKNDEFNPSAWFQIEAVKPQIAKRIQLYYQPLRHEIGEALATKDPAYSRWSRTELKKYYAFIDAIIEAGNLKPARKKRTKVRKPK